MSPCSLPASLQVQRVRWCAKGGPIWVVADSLLEFFERLAEGMPPWFLRPGYEPLEVVG